MVCYTEFLLHSNLSSAIKLLAGLKQGALSLSFSLLICNMGIILSYLTSCKRDDKPTDVKALEQSKALQKCCYYSDPLGR